MKTIKSFSDLQNLFSSITPRRRVAVVSPHDQHTQSVVERCLQFDLAVFTLVCSEPSPWATRLRETYSERVDIIETAGVDEAAAAAVSEIRKGFADVVMKGAINTDNLLRAVLNKETGLLPPGNILTHVTAAQLPSYNKLLFFSDAAVIPTPELPQLKAMIDYDTALLRKLNIETPKVALIHFTEKSNPKYQHTVFYERLKLMAKEGCFGENIIIDGPMDVKAACDSRSARIKHITSPIAGQADLLIFPDLVAANTFYKSISLFGQATMAGIICGASAPIVIPSRADSAESKFYSLALACIAQS